MTFMSNVLVTCERTILNKGSENKPIQINFKFQNTFSNTIQKRYDNQDRHLLLNQNPWICIKG